MPENEAGKKALGVPRGTSDAGVSDSIKLNEAVAVIEEVFKRFGFSPIDTPAIENLDTLNAKAYGTESAKEVFTLSDNETGLRFDFTVPLARFMAMNKDLALPFKRYQIGKLWRKEEPQRMRAREFIQADIDIVGSREIWSDAEAVAATANALEKLGINDYAILLNHRGILGSILDIFKVPVEIHIPAIRVLDKLAKQSIDDTTKQLVQLGMPRENAEELLAFIGQSANNDEKLAKLEANSESAKPNAESMRAMLGILKQYGVKGEVKIDFSLARGLDYYTGMVWEFVIFNGRARLPTIASGGRYDNLISQFSKTSLPAVGSSIGLTRVMGLLEGKGTRKSYVTVFVGQIGDENRGYALNICKLLREAGIYTDMNVTSRSISKQLEYANAIGAMYVVVAGNQEKSANKAKLRDMTTGKEELLDFSELISKLKSA